MRYYTCNMELWIWTPLGPKMTPILRPAEYPMNRNCTNVGEALPFQCTKTMFLWSTVQLNEVTMCKGNLPQVLYGSILTRVDSISTDQLSSFYIVCVGETCYLLSLMRQVRTTCWWNSSSSESAFKFTTTLQKIWYVNWQDDNSAAGCTAVTMACWKEHLRYHFEYDNQGGSLEVYTMAWR